jgi:alkane 1-monooxygenase
MAQILRFSLSLLLISTPFSAWALYGRTVDALVWSFVILPALDMLFRAKPAWSVARPVDSPTRPAFQWVTWVTVPSLYALVAWGVQLAPSLSTTQLVVLALSIGTATGGIGITVAHEMGHRAGRTDRTLSQVLLVLVAYGHFYVEHNRGHHARIGTREDPATARRNETVYAFWARSIFFSFAHALKLEAMRRQRLGLSVLHDRVWQLSALTVLPAAGSYAWAGAAGLAMFALQAAFAVLLLESTNYIEHYGLTRAKGEKVDDRHSWDCDNFFSNSFLFNLERHADHHAHPERPYESLRATATSPQLPTGYSGMILLSLVPPLWRAVMHPRIDAYQQQQRLVAA